MGFKCKHSKISIRRAILTKSLPSLSACLCLSLIFSGKKRKHSSGTTEHIPFFQLFWLRAICFNDELILRVHCAALPARAVMPFAHVRSGPRSNLRLITAGEAKSRNGTQLLPAALNYISTTGFPSPSFGVFLLVSAASLFVFDLSLFPALFSPPFPSQS